MRRALPEVPRWFGNVSRYVPIVVARLAAAGILTQACFGSGASGQGSPAASSNPLEMGKPCAHNAECTQPTPFCDATGGHCVECFINSHCPGTGLLCRTTDHTCVHCLTIKDCGPRRPYCAPEGKCVQCLGTDNCGSPEAICNPGPKACVPLCTSDADCAGSIDYPKCDTKLGGCTECLTDADCPGRFCMTPEGICVACIADTDCPAEQPYCDPPTHTCVTCKTNADCLPGQVCFGSVCSTIPSP